MKVVITGALGHIGSYLSRRLPKLFPNDEFLLLDNLSTQRYCSLFNLPSNCSFIETDVTQENLPFYKNANYVIHLAALTDAAGSFERASLVEKNNFEATKNVATECAKASASLIHLSSTSVYGTQASKIDEGCSLDELKPQSPYAETKLKEEQWLKDYQDKSGLKHISLRFGTIAGISPGMRFHTAVNKFSWQASLGLPITVWETALHQKRPYLDLKDACSAVEFIITKNIFDGSVYNVLTANHTVNEIITIIKKTVNDLRIELVKVPIMNQLSYEVLDNKIRDKGFINDGSIENAINETLELLGSKKNHNI